MRTMTTVGGKREGAKYARRANRLARKAGYVDAQQQMDHLRATYERMKRFLGR